MVEAMGNRLFFFRDARFGRNELPSNCSILLDCRLISQKTVPCCTNPVSPLPMGQTLAANYEAVREPCPSGVGLSPRVSGCVCLSFSLHVMTGAEGRDHLLRRPDERRKDEPGCCAHGDPTGRLHRQQSQGYRVRWETNCHRKDRWQQVDRFGVYMPWTAGGR